MDRTNELEEHVQRLTGEVDEMRARMARLESGEPGHQNGTEPKNRRGFLKFGAGAVLGALGIAATKVLPAAAATSGNFILGTPNAAGATTGLTGDTTATPITGPNPVLQVQAATFSSAKLATALGSTSLRGAVQALGGDQIGPPNTIPFEGIDAFATGATAYSVYGLTDAGTGVVGESNTGIGLYARRSGRIRQEGLGAAGAPSYAPNSFEQVRDANGVLWIHGLTQTGLTNQGRWRRVNTVRFDTADGTGGFFKPFRLVDTRLTGGPKGTATFNDHVVLGTGSGASMIPADAIGIVGNLTAVGYNSIGFLTIMPKGVAYDPSVDPSSVNLIPGAGAVANAFIVGLGTGGTVTVFIGSPGSSNYIIDITGYIQ